MMMTRTHKEMQMFGTILMLSAWGFAIAIASFLFLTIGYHLDKMFGTSPTFMIGLFFLAIFLTIGRLYQEAWAKHKEV
jgi:F0F1-type ATP synthase assembly protein I